MMCSADWFSTIRRLYRRRGTAFNLYPLVATTGQPKISFYPLLISLLLPQREYLGAVNYWHASIHIGRSSSANSYCVSCGGLCSLRFLNKAA